MVSGDAGRFIALHTAPFLNDTSPPPPGPLGQFLVGGPPPASLNIAPRYIRHALDNAALGVARQYATPASATALGARAPEAHMVQVSPRRALPTVAGVTGYPLPYGLLRLQ